MAATGSWEALRALLELALSKKELGMGLKPWPKVQCQRPLPH